MKEKQVLSGTGIDATTAATTRLGYVMVHKYGGSVEVVEAIVRQTKAKDATFNIKVGGKEIFSSDKSVAKLGSAEIFIPDQNKYHAASMLAVDFVVKTSSGTAGSKFDVSVLFRKL